MNIRVNKDVLAAAQVRKRCKACGGKGESRSWDRPKQVWTVATCTTCKGSGRGATAEQLAQAAAVVAQNTVPPGQRA